jgi:hypothetical protein
MKKYAKHHELISLCSETEFVVMQELTPVHNGDNLKSSQGKWTIKTHA